MPKQRPLGDDDDDDLIVEEDEQEDEPEEQEDEPAEQPDEEPEEPAEEPDAEEAEPQRRPQPKREDKQRAAKAREKAIKQRARLREAETAAAEAKREAAELRRQLAEREASSADDTIARIDRELARAEADLTRAIEYSEPGEQFKAQRAIAKLEAEKLLATRDAASRKAAPAADQQQDQQQAPAFDMTTLPKHVLAWVARHGYMAWSDEERALATKIGAELQDEGYEDGEPEYLQELDARLKEFIPHRLNSGMRRNGEPHDLRRPQRRAAPSPSTEERSSLPKTGPKRSLTAGERRHLRDMYGGEPNPDQVRAYLRANPTPLNIR